MLRLKSYWFVILLSCLVLSEGQDNGFVPHASAETEITDEASWSAIDEHERQIMRSMVQTPDEALRLSNDLIALLEVQPNSAERTLRLSKAKWLKAEALNRTGRSDLAAPVAENALEQLDGIEAASPMKGDILLTLGRINQRAADVQSAHNYLLQAYDIFLETDNRRKQAMTLQKIAELYQDARDFERALYYLNDAIAAYDASDDPSINMANNNNKAMALQGLERYSEATSSYIAALEVAQAIESTTHIARIMNNIAETQFLAGELESADATAELGLQQISGDEGAEWKPFLWGTKAQVAYAKGDLGAAQSYIELMFQGQDLSSTPIPFRGFHEAAYRLYSQIGQHRSAFEHLQAVKRLDDETARISSNANTALAAARFDFANQEEKLRRVQLEQEIQAAEARTRQRNLIFAFVLGGGLIVLGFVIAGYLSVRRNRDAIRAVNETLNETNVRLEKANSAKSDFLAMTSHEIRTPLNGILGMSQVLAQDKGLSETVRDKISVVLSAGNSMKAIVDDILDVAKMESGEVAIHTEETYLPELLDDICLLWENAAESKGLIFKRNIQISEEYLQIDPKSLRQILFNLLSNAVKFTEKGEILFSARTETAIDGTCSFIASIEDTGIGIPEEEHQNIFQPFYQVDSAKTRKFAGTGLGLSICRNFAEAMNGTLTVKSSADNGACFTLELPVEVVQNVENTVTSDTSTTSNKVSKPNSAEEARLLILQTDFMQKMIFEAYFADEVDYVNVVDNTDDFEREIESGHYHFAIAPDTADLDWPELAETGRSNSVSLVKHSSESMEKVESSDIEAAIGEYTPELIFSHVASLCELSVAENNQNNTETSTKFLIS